MNLGLLLKLWPIIQSFVPKHCLSFGALTCLAGWFLVSYVDAKHEQVTKKIIAQEKSVTKEIEYQAALTNQQIVMMTELIKETKAAIQKNNDKIFRAVNRIRTN